MGLGDERTQIELEQTRDDARLMDMGRESLAERLREPRNAVELGPALDNILIQSWNVLKGRHGRGD